MFPSHSDSQRPLLPSTAGSVKKMPGIRSVQGRNTPVIKDPTAPLRWGIWAYFFLLIFEGALRKWVLPGLATPLLIVRDPLALWLVVTALIQGKLVLNGYVSTVGVIGFLGIITALTMGHGSLPVALYGARILLLHFPLVFLIGAIFSREDVVTMGKVTLWILIPMTVLIGLQFYSPQSAWVNRGVAGNAEGAGFSGALGYFRPPATFSFTNGTTLFYSFAAPFILFFWLGGQGMPKSVLVAATVGLLAAIPLSISRSLFFQVVLTGIFAAMVLLRKPQAMGRFLLGALVVAGSLGLLSMTSFFGTAADAFTARFEMANEAEGGMVEGVLIDRFLGGLYGAVFGAADQPIFGYGIGMGTNVGSMLLSGDAVFLIAEGEWGRVVGELGAIFGLMLIALRVTLAASLAAKANLRLALNDLLPWLLLSFGLITIAQGGWAQPTALGFFVMSGGLLMASLNEGQGQTEREGTKSMRRDSTPRGQRYSRRNLRDSNIQKQD